MANPDTILFPFHALRYRPAGKRDLSDLFAPPYDIISDEMRSDLLARHPNNFVRVELPEDGDDRYARAAGTMKSWLAEGVLARDAEPAFYLLEQEFRIADRTLCRRGVFGAVRLPTGGEHYVLPHEGTLSAPKADRLQLIRACRAMTSPILLMHEDSDGSLVRLMSRVDTPPDATARDSAGVVHRFWVLDDPETKAAASASVGRGPLFIADGHHRFETALAYRDEMLEANPHAPAEAGFNHALALVTSAADENLEIFPTHRLLSCPGEEARQAVKERMREYFEVHQWELPDPAGLGRQPWLEGTAADRHVFGAYCGDGAYYVLIARDELLGAQTSVVDRLDVSVLHRCLVDPILSGAGSAPDTEGRVSHDSQGTAPACPGARLRYVTDEQQAIAAVDQGDYNFALFLRPTRVSDVLTAARAGERMPGKSTYFYPKVPAGLVISEASPEPI